MSDDEWKRRRSSVSSESEATKIYTVCMRTDSHDHMCPMRDTTSNFPCFLKIFYYILYTKYKSQEIVCICIEVATKIENKNQNKVRSRLLVALFTICILQIATLFIIYTEFVLILFTHSVQSSVCSLLSHRTIKESTLIAHIFIFEWF